MPFVDATHPLDPTFRKYELIEFVPSCELQGLEVCPLQILQIFDLSAFGAVLSGRSRPARWFPPGWLETRLTKQVDTGGRVVIPFQVPRSSACC